MKNMFKRSLALVLSVVLIAGLLCTGVSAADDRPVRVEIDGKAVAFTDAEPMALNGRVCVPFRAVFEALGAEVGYDGKTKTVSATRNGTTVSFPIGSSVITVETGTYSYKNVMDAAAFTKGGRTYIPVRYAAEALGCCVGWDADDRTVIIVDTESMVNKAIDAGQFTIAEKFMDYAGKLNKGNYEVKMKMDLAATLLATKVLNASYDIKGIVAGNTAGEMSMTIKMDMGGLVDLMAKLGGGDRDEILALLAEQGITDTKMTVTYQARMDLAKGAMYISMSGVPGMEELLPKDTWLYIDINELLEELGGLGVNPLELSKSVKSSQILVSLVNEMGYIYDRDRAYGEIKAQVDDILRAFSDSAFVKNGMSYTNTQKIDQMGMTVTLRLNTNSAGEVVGYELGADAAVPLDELGFDASDLAVLGEQLGVRLRADDLKLTVRTGMDANNRQTLKMEMSAGNILLVTVNAEGSYTSTSKVPNTALPAGAKSVGLEQWLESLYD